MASGLGFRWAEVSDFEAVLDLAAQLAISIEEKVPPLTAAQFETYYVNPGAPMHLLLAVRDGGVVGMISWTLMHELYSADTRVYISDVSVNRSARGQGVGAALMAEVSTWARRHNASKMGWEVWHRNFRAMTFYERLGASINKESVPYVLEFKEESQPPSGRESGVIAKMELRHAD
jgi:GNAT superfamily N-acetyltransferase